MACGARRAALCRQRCALRPVMATPPLCCYLAVLSAFILLAKSMIAIDIWAQLASVVVEWHVLDAYRIWPRGTECAGLLA